MIANATELVRRNERDLRVLVIAEAANPEWVSVPLVGWSHSCAIAKITDAHIVTQVRNQGSFERAGVDSETYTAIDSEALAAPMHNLANRLGGRNGKGWTIRTALSSLSYYHFERLVWRAFKARIEAGEFDIVHRITPLSPTQPSILARKCRKAGVPFIVGPLNGGVPWPAGFDSARRKEREWLSYVRSIYRILPGYASTRRDASAIIIASRDTWKQMPARFHHKCIYIPENGLDHTRLPKMRREVPTRPLRLVFLGRLVPYKGADMLVEAASPLVKAGLMHLTIIGDGPDRQRIESLIRGEGLQRRIHLTGWVEHARAQELLRDADCLGSPSVREFGGGVVLEAMAAGVVPIVLNYGGPGELVTDASGYRIAMGSRQEIIARFRSVLSDLARDPMQLIAKAESAQRRTRLQFTWQKKAEQSLEVYRWVLGMRSTKPDFGMPLPDFDDAVAKPQSRTVDLAAGTS